jgi:hypothetical protein
MAGRATSPDARPTGTARRCLVGSRRLPVALEVAERRRSVLHDRTKVQLVVPRGGVQHRDARGGEVAAVLLAGGANGPFGSQRKSWSGSLRMALASTAARSTACDSAVRS